MRTIDEIKQIKSLHIEQMGMDGGCGHMYLGGIKAKSARIVFSWGGGWEHVSVSYSTRCPTWEEMCRIKDMFWDEEECVVQYHPPKSEYINRHPYCLNLWRKCGENFETPPKGYV